MIGSIGWKRPYWKRGPLRELGIDQSLYELRIDGGAAANDRFIGFHYA